MFKAEKTIKLELIHQLFSLGTPPIKVIDEASLLLKWILKKDQK